MFSCYGVLILNQKRMYMLINYGISAIDMKNLFTIP